MNFGEFCRKSVKGYASDGEYHFIKQLKDMYSREKENNIMGLIDVKEKVIKTLGEFLDKNEKYVIGAYISNPVTNHIIGRMNVTTDRVFKATEKGITLEWNDNNLFILYDEVLACYDETDEYDQQMVFVVLKCGVSIDFDCIEMM